MGRKLGQHFLKNKKVLEKVANSLDIRKGDFVVEIGPGHGELTDFLVERGAEVTVIEKDEKLADVLEERYNNRIRIINGDALTELPVSAPEKGIYKIAGNIPYYITGYLFRIVGELENKPERGVFIIQKEVAQRICAKKGDMNLLAASIRIWADPEIISSVPSGDFSPPPKVDSAIIRLTVKSRKSEIDLSRYYKTVKIIFRQPRKTVINNLAAGIGKENRPAIEQILKKLEIDPLLRPQDLSMEDLVKISDNMDYEDVA